MDEQVKRYYKLKQQQKEIEQSIKELRDQITTFCESQGEKEVEVGAYRVKLVHQYRKEYDDAKLYDALPDPDVWRLLSKVDSSKVTSLIQLKVIPEERIKDTYSLKQVTLLHVDKK
ncbi:hypothetical protein [Paenibacillus pini]|uniref:Uncharacterized protein n=1 Tax=Paenibacillus pini JCM 16418 TaxID=1236976 RepID=W7Y918_9BACL|nr:hypothetical protein [Paenibacillus pini]GAF07470.1 hypothetical protein JCM16418_1487 [Paenibacillus pini JCM 16418]